MIPPTQLARCSVVRCAARTPRPAPRLQHGTTLVPHATPAPSYSRTQLRAFGHEPTSVQASWGAGGRGRSVALADWSCRCAIRNPYRCRPSWSPAVQVQGGAAAPPHRCFSSDSDDDDHERGENRYNEQRLKLEAVQAASTGWWQRQRNKVFLAYILQANEEFDIEEFAEGAALVFEALNTTMYSGEQITEETFHAMAHDRIGRILSGVMQDYAKDGIQMFPTSDEPSGYDLHSVKIARLAVREIAEIAVDNDVIDSVVNTNSSHVQEDSRQEAPKSAIELGTEAIKHTPPKTVEVVKEPTYLDMKKKQAAAQVAKERGDSDSTDSDADETGSDELEYIEYACIDVEYKATETFTMIGPDGKLVDGSDLPRERTMVYTIRGRLDQGEDFDWEVFDMPQL